MEQLWGQREKDACLHHHHVTVDPHAARHFLPDTVTLCHVTVCRGAASLPGAGTGQDVAAVVCGELGTPTQPTGRMMLVPAQPQSLVTSGWVTVPAEPHGVGRGRDRVAQGP